ncbi:insulin-like 3 [Trichechus inunguis]|uniref:Insulin-like 3 n=1 Tax=Trichechus manatus latirostris TaxID=127582 RepID=A0A2Y9RGX7_TRIMA|nr:insulin-like 3 [Trichechus manatus latirostris]
MDPMDPSPPTWALVLLVPVLALALGPAPDPEASPEKLCGAHFVRTLVRVCGGPRWSPEAGQPAARGDRELLKWLEGHLLHGLVANRDLYGIKLTTVT